MAVGQVLRSCRLTNERADRVDARFPQHLAIISRRPLAPGCVNLAAISEVPGIRTKLLPLLAVAHPADAGLADVVHRSPNEIADDPRLRLDLAPIGESIFGKRLAREHHLVGQLRV